ncbi:TBC1 domain family member 25 [Merluccius polli]|uniref:TBC1 domain family member 25 n=1 Tax=Merluccius polli TaxID=89951 RepID=A0AA47M1K9_MERPO|nr:TBC1 domain family member 25 [Merluccius polli]
MDSQVGPQVLDSEVGPQVLDSEVGPQVLDSQVGPQVLDSQVDPQILDSQVGLQVLDSQNGLQVLDSQVGLQVLDSQVHLPALHSEESGDTTDLDSVRGSGDQSRRADCSLPPEESVAPPASLTASPPGLPGVMDGVMDAEGRVDESRLRTYILKNGGVCPSERGLAWRFLFGVFPCSSTAAERPLLAQQMAVRYQVMKSKWRQSLPAAVRLRLNGTDAELVAAVRFHDQRQAAARQQAEEQREEQREEQAEEQREQAEEQREEQREEVRERLSFLQLQAQVLFERVTFDLDDLQEAIRIIDKDVPRTDRDLTYFLGEGSGNLLVLRDILITYAAFHPEVSYAQGMNDLCSRFLEVLDSEVDTYWSFSCCMEKFSKDFRADGLHRKIVNELWMCSGCEGAVNELWMCSGCVAELAAALLRELDPQLHDHLVTEGMESFTFCHRWLLLGFQREFEHGDALRLFEILSCNHLELISQQVDRARTTPAPAPRAVNAEFTFELFICATILIENREALLPVPRRRTAHPLHQQGTLDLNSILQNAETHFYNYCKRCARDFMNGCCKPRDNKDFFYQLRSFFF